MTKRDTTTFLFAHEPRDAPRRREQGTGAIAQASIGALSYSAAKKEFERLYPDRVITTTGILGAS
jgi:hypothetical protein